MKKKIISTVLISLLFLCLAFLLLYKKLERKKSGSNVTNSIAESITVPSHSEIAVDVPQNQDAELCYDELKQQLLDQWRECREELKRTCYIENKEDNKKAIYNYNEHVYHFHKKLVNACKKYPYDSYLYCFVTDEGTHNTTYGIPRYWFADLPMKYKKLLALAIFPDSENACVFSLFKDFVIIDQMPGAVQETTTYLPSGEKVMKNYAGLELADRTDNNADFYKNLMDNDKRTFAQARKMLCYLADRLDMEKLDERQLDIVRGGKDLMKFRGRLSAEEIAEMEAAWRCAAIRLIDMKSVEQIDHEIEIADYAEAAEEEARRIELLRQERAARMPGVKASREDLDRFLESISGEERRWTVPMLKDALDRFRLYSAMLRSSPDLPDYVRMGDEVYKDRRELEMLNICYRLGVTGGREEAANAIEAIDGWDGDERLVWLRLQCVDARNLSRKDARLVRRLGPALLGFDPGNPEYRSWGEMAKKL